MTPEEQAERDRLAMALETAERLLEAFDAYLTQPRQPDPLALTTIQQKRRRWQRQAA